MLKKPKSARANLHELMTASDVWTCGNSTEHIKYLSSASTAQQSLGMTSDDGQADP